MAAGDVRGGGFHPTFVWISTAQSFVGVVFNAVVLYMGYANPHLRRDTGTLLQLMLAVTDLCTTSVIFAADVDHLVAGYFAWGNGGCARIGIASVFLFGVSIVLLCLIALDRYWLLVRLRRLSRRTARKLLSYGVVLVLVFALLPVLGLGQHTARPGLSYCIVNWQADDAGGVVYASVIMAVVGGSIAWVSHAYWKMFAAVRKALRMRLAITQSSTTYAKEVRTARRLFVLAAAYVAAWLPLTLSVSYEFIWRRHTSVSLDIFVYLVTYANCVVNPVLLVVMHVRFRRAFASLLADALVALGCAKQAQVVVGWRNHTSGGGSHAHTLSGVLPNSDIRQSGFFSSSMAEQPLAAPAPPPGPVLRSPQLVQVMPAPLTVKTPASPLRSSYRGPR